MKAMIFAAGLGTRLRPITDHTPKALVKAAGKPMLQRTIEHLHLYGFNDLIVNVHHHAQQVEDFLKNYENKGFKISVSDEKPALLDTGGGLKKASWFFDDDEPFLVINADVISNLDLSRLMEYHKQQQALVTLVVRNRSSSRCFLFDREFQLRGWENKKTGQQILSGNYMDLKGWSFSGIHVLEPKIFDLMEEEGKFSIVDVYLRLAPDHKIVGFPDNDSVWFDIGDIGKLKKAEEWLSKG